MSKFFLEIEKFTALLSFCEGFMNIQKFSKMTDISAYTIRYYEKIGLLKNISRNSSGHRWFTEKDIIWIEFIKRLKDTGMPLDNIRKYADLRDAGASTSELRMQILQQHAVMLEDKIVGEQFHLKKLKEKIEHYSEIIELELRT
jgi:DNA-binding transcriptional MerR regulator